MSDGRSSSNLAVERKDGEKNPLASGLKQPTGGSEETSTSTDVPRGGGIDSLFDRLDIGEEEFDDLIIEDVDVDLAESTRWLAVARVNCGKGFSHDAFFQQMRAAWNSVREISIRPVGANRFVIQCFCLGDWEKVTERGPWLFRDWAVIIAPYDGISDPEVVELEFMPVWIQIHKIPEAYRKEAVVRTLVTRQVREVVVVEMHPPGGFRGDFVRVRIKQDARKPLSRFVSVSLGGKRSVFAVKYEKLGMLCFACGLIGHVHKECGTGVFEDKDLKFGEWIHAFPSRGRGAGSMRGGLRGGRGVPMAPGGRGIHAEAVFNTQGRGNLGMTCAMGRGNYFDWRDHPERKTSDFEGKLSDTASSPNKVNDQLMTDVEKNAKKRLAFGPNIADGETLAITNEMHVDVENSPNIGEEYDQANKDKKRYKKEDGTSISGQSNGSAASPEDDRRVQ
jgi:hypothetical protein